MTRRRKAIRIQSGTQSSLKSRVTQRRDARLKWCHAKRCAELVEVTRRRKVVRIQSGTQSSRKSKDLQRLRVFFIFASLCSFAIFASQSRFAHPVTQSLLPLLSLVSHCALLFTFNFVEGFAVHEKSFHSAISRLASRTRSPSHFSHCYL